MENILNQYPEYKKNQVLTDVSLNTSYNFLEQQTRLSRFGLTPTGIIEDLRYQITKTGVNKISHISINKGFGVSTDGYFMPHNYNTEAQVYTHCKPYQFILKPKQIDGETTVLTSRNEFLNELAVPPFAQQPIANIDFTSVIIYELLTAEMATLEDSPVLLSSLISGNYKLALFLEINSKSSDNCTPNSCDDGGNLITQRTVPLLISDANDLLIKKINCRTEQKNFIKLKRFSNLCLLRKGRTTAQEILTAEYSRLNTQNTISLMEKLESINTWAVPLSIKDKWVTKNLVALQNGMNLLDGIMTKYIPQVFSQDYPYNYGFVAQETGKVIPKSTTAYKDKVKNPRFFILRSSSPTTNEMVGRKYCQYYYDFCLDLEQAINEFVTQYNQFIFDYKTSYDKRLKQLLVLGNIPKKFDDSYTYFNIENFANTSFQNTKDMLFKHFKRIFILIKKFDLGFPELKYKTDIKLIPTRNRCSLLEDRAIPFYYRQDLELEKNWIVNQIHKPLKTNIYQYRDLNPPYSHFAYNISAYNGFRIEGHIGKTVETIKKELENLKLFFNIPLYYSFIDIDGLVLAFDDVGGSASSDEKVYILRNTIAGLEHIAGVEFGYHFVLFYEGESIKRTSGSIDKLAVIADFQCQVPFNNNFD